MKPVRDVQGGAKTTRYAASKIPGIGPTKAIARMTPAVGAFERRVSESCLVFTLITDPGESGLKTKQLAIFYKICNYLPQRHTSEASVQANVSLFVSIPIAADCRKMRAATFPNFPEWHMIIVIARVLRRRE